MTQKRDQRWVKWFASQQAHGHTPVRSRECVPSLGWLFFGIFLFFYFSSARGKDLADCEMPISTATCVDRTRLTRTGPRNPSAFRQRSATCASRLSRCGQVQNKKTQRFAAICFVGSIFKKITVQKNAPNQNPTFGMVIVLPGTVKIGTVITRWPTRTVDLYGCRYQRYPFDPDPLKTGFPI